MKLFNFIKHDLWVCWLGISIGAFCGLGPSDKETYFILVPTIVLIKMFPPKDLFERIKEYGRKN